MMQAPAQHGSNKHSHEFLHLQSLRVRLTTRLLLMLSLVTGLGSAPLAQAQDSTGAFEWAPQLKTGTALPAISAQDQNGALLTTAQLVGENGLVLVLSRSFDWCPYCIRQLQQLAEVAPQFEAMGIHVAAMTYDSLEILKEAAEEHGTAFPLLSDAQNHHVKAMGILNTEYEPGHRAYGIPYPGIFLLDEDGVIRARFAEEDYRLRPDFSLVLEAAALLQ